MKIIRWLPAPTADKHTLMTRHRRGRSVAGWKQRSNTTISCEQCPSQSQSCSPARQVKRCCYVINVCATEMWFRSLLAAAADAARICFAYNIKLIKYSFCYVCVLFICSCFTCIFYICMFLCCFVRTHYSINIYTAYASPTPSPSTAQVRGWVVVSSIWSKTALWDDGSIWRWYD